ncbi:MAG TPA: SIP domain-containing protein [Acidimicrobiales bacterium]
MPTIEEEVAEHADEYVESMNGEFSDATLFVAQVLGERPAATAARVVGLSPDGVDLAVTGVDGGEERVTVAFPERVTTLDELTMALFNLVTRAREVSGTEGTTSAEAEIEEIRSYRTMLAEVVAVEDVHPHLRRITFSGDDLEGMVLPGPDAFLYVLLPPPGRTELTIDASFTWEGYHDMPEEERPVGAYYTVRRWDPETRRVEMLFVLHGDADGGGEGPASSWAAKAAVGDPVALWGPRTSFAPPEGTRRYLLVGDETGLPAIAAIIEWLDPDVPVQVVAEVADAASRQELPARPGVDVVWCHRDGAEAGTTTLLLDAVRALPPLSEGTYVWGGGESRTFARLRRHVRQERGLPQEAVDLIAYWRRDAAPGETDEVDEVEAGAALADA